MPLPIIPTFPGTTGNDVYVGANFISKFSLKDWDDYWIKGIAGNDTLTGGNGDDKVDGGTGNDTLKGGYGKNELIGGDGIDTLDYSFFGKNANVTSTGGGVDVAFGTTVQQVNSLAAGLVTRDTFSGIEQVIGSNYNDKFFGDAANQKFWGGAGNDQLNGAGGNDWISGGSGKDAINGGVGRDKLYGNSGNDVINGQGGVDKIYGGTGGDKINSGLIAGELDTLYYGSIKESTVDFKTRDVIYFEHGRVLINLEAIDTNSKKGGDQDFIFVGREKFSGRAGELRFDASDRQIEGANSTTITGDLDGDKKADFAISVFGNRGFVKDDFDL